MHVDRNDMNNTKPQPDARLTFLREFLRHPDEVGSLVPSSRFLERRLVEMADVPSARLIVELGPGTGGTTQAMLRALPPDARLLVIEINPRFVALLRALHDPRLIVHEGNALDLRRALARHHLGAPDVVLSGIPFSTIPPSVGRRILREIWVALAPGGRFVAYQLRDSVSVLARELMGAPDVGIELRNAPPMRLYRWQKDGFAVAAAPAAD
jgi:phospholipid N-methyltransferase